MSEAQLLQQKEVEDAAQRYNAKYGRMNRTSSGAVDPRKYDCPICRNKGYIQEVDFVESRGYFSPITKRCVCWAEREGLKNRVHLDAINASFALESFIAKENWQKTMLSAADDYVTDGIGRFLYIGGAIGCGKSHLCFGVVRKFVELYGKRTKVMFWSADVMRLKNFEDENYFGLIDSFSKPDVLYIEDFYKRATQNGISEADKNIAFDIINSRYLAKKQTILSSEYHVNELIGIDSAVGSRIHEMCGDRFQVNISREAGRNYRLKKRNEQQR